MDPRRLPRQSCLPSAQKGLTPEVAARLYFSTSSSASFKDPTQQVCQYVDGAALAREARAASLKSVHGGFQPYQTRRAPGPSRTMCTYTSDYIQQPLDALPMTKEMGDLFAKKSTHGNTVTSTPLSLSSVTTTRAVYVKHKKGGQGEICRPEQTRHTDPEAKLLETKTNMNRDFVPYDTFMRNIGRAAIARPGPDGARPVGNAASGGPLIG